MVLDFNPQGLIMPAEGSGVKEEQEYDIHEIFELSEKKALRVKSGLLH